jgi:hypothetical protein
MKRLPLSSPVRVQPFTGLVIDVDTWTTAHDYHRRHHQLHLLSLHGSGIASGLDVYPTDPPSEVVVIEPGVAVDDAGNVIIVPEQQRVSIEAQARTNYIVLDYIESLPATANANGQETRGRMLEDFRVRVLPSLPEGNALELARVAVSPQTKSVAVGSAKLPAIPADNELDLRFRLVVGARPAEYVRIGLVVIGAPGKLPEAHMRGVHNWIRELRAFGLRVSLLQSEAPEVPAADLIFVTGAASEAPSAKLITALSEQMKRGAWLFGDACGPGVELIEGIVRAVKTDADSESITESRVLNAWHVFGQAPKGASTTQEIVWRRNALISPRDFGCAWSGRHGDQPLAREQIRNALEFGVNIAICASERRA